MKQITIREHNGSIIIDLPKDLLVFAANDNPIHCMRVTDEEAFIKAFKHRVEHFANSNEVEVGLTHLHQFLDDIIVDIYESGEEGIEEANVPLSLEQK